MDFSGWSVNNIWHFNIYDMFVVLLVYLSHDENNEHVIYIEMPNVIYAPTRKVHCVKEHYKFYIFMIDLPLQVIVKFVCSYNTKPKYWFKTIQHY
jgi:hypothetical protein